MIITESGDIVQRLINKYLNKLQGQGLADKDKAILLALDADLCSNKPIDDDVQILSKVFDLMNINTILFSEPAEPYNSIINEIMRYDYLCRQENRIIPMDCETRTFFHDIPVIDELSPNEIAKALSHRKSAIIRNKGIVTYGTVTPEQAFVSFSSACFSTFVKYFFDSLMYFEECYAEGGVPDETHIRNFDEIVHILPSAISRQKLISEPPQNEDDVLKVLSEAGRTAVECRLVDSYFGNISYVYENKIYISQTGSSLDELECCIDAVPMNGSSSVGITASSELSAHKSIYYETKDNAILHGHPKFSVIMSMKCDNKDCRHYLPYSSLNKGGIRGGVCHKSCKEKRYVADVPIVSGEIGTGPTGLMHTVPFAMKEGKGVIVYGHGVFTSGRDSFQRPFDMLMDIENRCREEYFKVASAFLQS